MGRDSQAACLNCRKRYVFGYAPGTSWIDHVDTVAAFDAELARFGLTPEMMESSVNHTVRAFLLEHDGHKLTWWSSDYAYVDDDGALRGDYDDDLIQGGIGTMPLFLWFEDRFIIEDEYPQPRKYA